MRKIVTRQYSLGEDIGTTVRAKLYERMLRQGVTITVLTAPIAIHAGGVRVRHMLTDAEAEIAADTVVLSSGGDAQDGLYHALSAATAGLDRAPGLAPDWGRLRAAHAAAGDARRCSGRSGALTPTTGPCLGASRTSINGQLADRLAGVEQVADAGLARATALSAAELTSPPIGEQSVRNSAHAFILKATFHCSKHTRPQWIGSRT